MDEKLMGTYKSSTYFGKVVERREGSKQFYWLDKFIVVVSTHFPWSLEGWLRIINTFWLEWWKGGKLWRLSLVDKLLGPDDISRTKSGVILYLFRNVIKWIQYPEFRIVLAIQKCLWAINVVLDVLNEFLNNGTPDLQYLLIVWWCDIEPGSGRRSSNTSISAVLDPVRPLPLINFEPV